MLKVAMYPKRRSRNYLVATDAIRDGAHLDVDARFALFCAEQSLTAGVCVISP